MTTEANKFKPIEGYPVGLPKLPDGVGWITNRIGDVSRLAFDPEGRMVSLHLMRCEGSVPDRSHSLTPVHPLSPNSPYAGGTTYSILYWEVRPVLQLEYAEPEVPKGEAHEEST